MNTTIRSGDAACIRSATMAALRRIGGDFVSFWVACGGDARADILVEHTERESSRGRRATAQSKANGTAA